MSANPSSTLAPATPKKKSRKRLWIIIGSLVLLVAVVGGVIAKKKGKEAGIPVTNLCIEKDLVSAKQSKCTH